MAGNGSDRAAPNDPGVGRLTGRIALITGATRGIGAAVARGFAAEGAHVLLTGRNVGGLEEVDDGIKADAKAGSGGKATLIPMDLSEFDGIDQMAGALYERFGKLDILVGNAGDLGLLTPVAQMEPAVWQRVIDINLTATWRLIRACDPLLRLSEAGRAIFVTSGAASQAPAFWGAYAVSKAALEMLVGIYAREVSKTSVRVNLLDPGAVRTRMRAAAFPGEDPDALRPPETLVESFLALADANCDRHGEVLDAGA